MNQEEIGVDPDALHGDAEPSGSRETELTPVIALVACAETWFFHRGLVPPLGAGG